MLFPALIEIDADGSASGFFPDVKGCYFAGNTPEHTLHDAHKALHAHFELMVEKGLLTRYLGKSERINITMPHLLIEKIDRVVGHDARYTSRSHFLAEAARKALSQS